jgi:CheY-like chemotaxis protein
VSASVDACLTEGTGVQFVALGSGRRRENSHMVESLNRVRVLVAEDNLINQKIVRIMLQKAGCEVLAVDDGYQAVQAVQTNPFDLVLMDLHMPQLDGLQATRQIRDLQSKAKEVPIIALTASAFTDDRDRCLAAGMNDFITKPIRLDYLLQKCSFWANRRAEAADVAAEAPPIPVSRA